MKKLLEYHFEYVQDLAPVLDRNGRVKEFYPQDGYEKKDTISLNRYGEGPFCRFSIHPKWSGVSGVYAFYIDDELVYIGQAIDLAKRFNMGYGNISPRNCFAGGQSTNCRINSVVLESVKSGKKVCLYFHITNRYDEIERILIKHFNPIHNVALSDRNTVCYQADRPLGLKVDEVLHPISIVGNTKNPSTDEVREYIRRQLKAAKERGEREFVVRSGEIHNRLGMTSAMPTVCSAMRTLGGRYRYETLEEPPKGNGSRLVFRYIL